MPLITSLLKAPFSLAARVGRAAESAVPAIFHPEEILSKSPNLKKLYDFTLEERRISRLHNQFFRKEVDDIVKKYGINTEERANQFLNFLELPYYQKRLPTQAEVTSTPPELVQATIEHLRRVTDPIHKLAKEGRPELGYVPGYFTHFPVKNYRNFLDDEINRMSKVLGDVGKDDPNFFNYKNHINELKKTLAKVSHADDSLNALRFKQLPKGGRFGPLDEARVAKETWGYRRDYQDLMHDYIDGATRKIFLDRYMPVAKDLIKAEPNNALRQYAFDYVMAQRGALASKSRLYLNDALAQLFPNPESGYSNIAKGVDVATRFQYMSKIGLSWFRFPFVNATQPLLTTYPMVGGKNFLLAYTKDITNPKIWEEARKVGVVFEASLRKGLVEALGRTPKLSWVERKLSWPAQISEEFNRVVTYAAGKRQAVEKGLKGDEIVKHAIGLVNRTQFLYQREALPLIMSHSPAGRLLFQFRTFTMNYVNFLTQLVRNKQWPELGKALGALGTLSGTAAVPFGAWDMVRKGLLRNAGIDIGEINPAEFVTEKLGFSPPIDLGMSLEPFNIPWELSQVLGPSVGPVVKLFFDWQREPERGVEHLKRFGEQYFGPPAVRLGKGIIKEARMEPTQTYPQGRVIGERPIVETLYLRPALETSRRRYMQLMANALAGGREDLARNFMERMRKMGIRFTEEDYAQVKAMATKLKGPPKIRKRGEGGGGVPQVRVPISETSPISTLSTKAQKNPLGIFER